MPRIVQYEAPENIGLRPSEVGITATAAAARRVGAEYSEAAAAKIDTGRRLGGAISSATEGAVKYADHQQISAGAPAFANFISAKEKQWNDISKNADPNDPTVAQKFLSENLEPDLEKFKSGFITEGAQRWAEAHVDQFRQHMFNKTSADMSTMAGQAAVVNQHRTVNGLSNAVYNDPSSLDFALGTLESTTASVVGSSPTLSATDAGRVKEQLLQTGREAIVKSAAIGYIEKTGKVPPWASDAKYSPYINGPELKQFQKAADAQAKSNLYYQKASEQLQRTADDQAVHIAANKNWADNVSIDPNTNRPVIKPDFFKQAIDIPRNNPNAPNAVSVAKTYLDWGQSQIDRKDATIHTDQTVYSDLLTRMLSTDNPTTEAQILQADTKRQLDPHDFAAAQRMLKFLEEAPLKTPIARSAMADARAVIGTDQIGAGLHNLFMNDFIPQYVQAVREGKGAGALDMKDPNSLISKVMASYKRNPMQMMMDRRSHGMLGAGGEFPLTETPGRAAPPASAFTPPPTWQFSASRQQYKDPATGKLYDLTGKEIK